MVYNLFKDHVSLLLIMLYCCRHTWISLNLHKCVFCVHFDNLLAHIVYKHGVLVDIAKNATIVNMHAPMTSKHLQYTLCHTIYYRIIIHNYAFIIAPLDKLLKKVETFQWNEDCEKTFNTPKEK